VRSANLDDVSTAVSEANEERSESREPSAPRAFEVSGSTVVAE